MATETPTTIAYQLRLSSGFTPTGNPKYVNVNLGKLSLVGYSLQSAADLSLLLQPILDKNTAGEFVTHKYQVSS